MSWYRRMRSLTAFCRLGWRPHVAVQFAGPFRTTEAPDLYDTIRMADVKWHTYCIWCGKELP